MEKLLLHSAMSKTDKGIIRSVSDAEYGVCYMLLPENYKSENIDKGLNGTYNELGY